MIETCAVLNEEVFKNKNFMFNLFINLKCLLGFITTLN